MGKEKQEDIVLNMEDALGLHETEDTQEPQENEEEVAAKEDEAATEQKPTEQKPTEQKPTEEKPTTKTTLVTDEQVAINKEIVKIDMQIEALEKEEVDLTQFYDNLEEELSEDEQQLEFSDKSAYMKLVSQKAKEYEIKHSKADDIEALKKEKEDKESMYERQSAIVAVSSKYSDYNHKEMLEYFTLDLKPREQQKILSESTSYQDVYEKTYQNFKSENPSNIQSEQAPNIPNVNNMRRDVASSQETEASFISEGQALRDALGL